MNKLVRKLKQNNGFTLSELLIATLILLLTSAMLVVCIQLGLKQLYKQTQDSEAQMLCTMLSTAIQDELTYASEIETGTTTAGNTITFAKEGMSNPVSFYIASETDDSDASDPSSFEYTAVTDDASFANINLGKIYLASTDASNKIVDPYGLVSTGAYNIENSSYGSLRAGMQLKQNADGYEVKVSVYNGSDDVTPLATKRFYVGKVTADRKGQVDVDVSADTMTRTLVFEPAGGYFADNTTTAKTYKGIMVGSTFAMPSVSRLPGYEFTGWMDTSNPNNLITSGSVTVNDDMTYTAQWRIKSYKASFYIDENAMYADTPLTTKNGDYGTDMTLPTTGDLSTLQKDGYDFAGWREGTNTYPVTGATWNVSGNQNFVATWTPKQYEVKFYKNGDLSNPSDLIETRYVYYKDTFTFPDNPTMDHYDFKGWKYERALDDTPTTTQPSMIYNFTKPMIFVAQWADHEYNASFVYTLNGTKNTITEVPIVYGGSLSFPNLSVNEDGKKVFPNIDGYIVSGWQYTIGGSQTQLDVDTTSITYNYDMDLEIEAILEPYYAANYYLDLVTSENPVDKANVYKSSDGYKLTLPSREDVNGMSMPGYRFTAWTYTLDGIQWDVSAPGTIITIDPDVTIDQNVNIYGMWEPATEFTITFNPGSNGSVTPTTITAGYNELVTLPTPSWNGNGTRRFVGWQINGEGNHYQGNYRVTEDVTFVADWQQNANTYRVTYNLPDYTKIDGQSSVTRYVLKNSVIYLEAPDGYDNSKTDNENGGRFAWLDSGSSATSYAVNSLYTVKSNTTFTGQWSGAWQVTVTFDPNGGRWGGGCNDTASRSQDIDSYVTMEGAIQLLADNNASVNKTGSTLVGWSADGDNVVDPAEKVGYTNGTKRTSVTLKALWR